MMMIRGTLILLKYTKLRYFKYWGNSIDHKFSAYFSPLKRHLPFFHRNITPMCPQITIIEINEYLFYNNDYDQVQ